MRVVFAADAIQDANEWRHLDRILYTVEDGWHEWHVDDPDALETSAWLTGTNRPSLRRLFEQAAVRSTYPRQGMLHRQIWVVTPRAGPGLLTPQAAARLFSLPLCVLVENRFTDGLFLEAILAVLAPAELVTFLDSCEASPWRCDGPGGAGELPKLIAEHIAEMQAEGAPARAVVFLDSDARFPGEVSPKASEVAGLCQAHAIPCHILHKRAIENYLPDEVLRGWALEPQNQVARDRVAALFRLTVEQRDHLPMKKGLPKSYETDNERTLYASIAPSDAALLRERGFRDKVIELLRTHRSHLSADGLRQRDGRGELDGMVAMIAQAF